MSLLNDFQLDRIDRDIWQHQGAHEHALGRAEVAKVVEALVARGYVTIVKQLPHSISEHDVLSEA